MTRGPVKATCEAISSTSTQPGPPRSVLIVFLLARAAGGGELWLRILSQRTALAGPQLTEEQAGFGLAGIVLLPVLQC